MAEMTKADVMLWLQAAIPPTPQGRLDRARAAQALGVSPRTLRRWISAPDRFPPKALRRLRQLAILRGHGRILWPTPSEETLHRDQTLADYSARAVADITNGHQVDFWTAGKEERMNPHTLYVLHYPAAHVFGITIAQDKKSLARLRKAGAQPVEVHHFDHYWAAQNAKMNILLTHHHDRCIAPATVMPLGRSEAWREPHHHGHNAQTINEPTPVIW